MDPLPDEAEIKDIPVVLAVDPIFLAVGFNSGVLEPSVVLLVGIATDVDPYRTQKSTFAEKNT